MLACLNLRQISMNKLNRDGSLAHAGSYAFHRPVADVAHCEHSLGARLQQERIAVRGPAARALPLFEHIRAGQDEAEVITLDETIQPVGARLRADEHEKRIGANPLYGFG